MNRFYILSFLVVFSVFVDFSAACNGYKLRLLSIENCLGDDQVITIDSNFTSDLSKDCILTTSGCITSKGFTQAKVKYVIKKDGMELLNGHPDICAELGKKNDEHKAKLQMFGFPTECPVPAGRKCVDPEKKLDISKFKNLLPMAQGKISAHYDITHDTGKSCMQIKLEIYK